MLSCMEKHQGQGGRGGQDLTSAAETLDWNTTVLLSDFPTRTKAGAYIRSYSHSFASFSSWRSSTTPSLHFFSPAPTSGTLLLQFLSPSCFPHWCVQASPHRAVQLAGAPLKTLTMKTFIQPPLSAEMKLSSFEEAFLLRNPFSRMETKGPAPCVTSLPAFSSGSLRALSFAEQKRTKHLGQFSITAL